MADLSRLSAAVDSVEAKLDAYNAKPPVVAVDDQPAIDALASRVEAIAAKVPA